MRGEEDKKVNSDKSSFDVLDLILITSIFAANWPLLSWGSKFTKSWTASLSSLFVGVIMKLSNFGSSLSDCQILGAPCQWDCQWWVAGRGWLGFSRPLVSGNLIYPSNLDSYLLPYFFIKKLYWAFADILLQYCTFRPWVRFCFYFFGSIIKRTVNEVQSCLKWLYFYMYLWRQWYLHSVFQSVKEKNKANHEGVPNDCICSCEGIGICCCFYLFPRKSGFIWDLKPCKQPFDCWCHLSVWSKSQMSVTRQMRWRAKQEKAPILTFLPHYKIQIQEEEIHSHTNYKYKELKKRK